MTWREGTEDAPAAPEVPSGPEQRSRLERLVARVVLSLWLPAVLVVCAYLLGGHVLTLPSPTNDNARLTSAVAAIRGPETPDRWIVLHVLYGGCRCSKRVLDHLLARGAQAGTTERIVFVSAPENADDSNDAATRARIEASGFELELISTDALASRYGIQAAPLLVVTNPAGAVRYVGGYTERKQAAVIQDRDIIRRLRGGETVPALPVFGCAVSAALEKSVDPLGLRR